MLYKSHHQIVRRELGDNWGREPHMQNHLLETRDGYQLEDGGKQPQWAANGNIINKQ